MRTLELLAPARNADIGIAAIDCGADAVYIAGPAFGARKDAGNSIEDVRRLCEHARPFGVRVFLTVNTIIYDGELEEVHSLMLAAQDAGVSGFIVQDPALTTFEDITVPLHASTQCFIRTPEKAAALEALGFSRLVLEREMSLEQIKAIREAVSAELEFFVHGALCVCYSGQCYMSQDVAGRSANRGECVQACRSLYDLTDANGRKLLKDKALLSLKDYNLLGRLVDLAAAGVDSFKIEGRLKNASYVKNVVAAYSAALDALIAANPELYRRASFGNCRIPFRPSLERTFNRGYTELFLDGRRGQWASMDAPKSMGEFIGTVASLRPLRQGSLETKIRPARVGIVLSNGDGFCVVSGDGITGFRGDICEGNTIVCKEVRGLRVGSRIWRNISAAFERELDRPCQREIPVELSVNVYGCYEIEICARSADGRQVSTSFKADLERAQNRERQLSLIREQLSKRSGHYKFSVTAVTGNDLPLLSAATLNSMRRCTASDLDALPLAAIPMSPGRRSSFRCAEAASYKDNIANATTRELYAAAGAKTIEDAFELTHRPGAELMRTKYCIKYELGMCSVHQGASASGPLFLENNGRRFSLGFDCSACEMTVKEA